MNLHQIDKIDKRILKKFSHLEKDLHLFRDRLLERGLDSEEDPTEISVIPRIVSREEYSQIEKMSKEVTETSFKTLNRFLDNPSLITSSPMNDYIKSLPSNQKLISGVGRLDFLKEKEDYKLIENNFVYIGSWRYLIEAADIWKNLFGKGFEELRSDSPIHFAKKRHEELGLEKVLLITNNLTEGAPRFMRKQLFPLDTHIATREDYSKIEIRNGEKVHFDGVEIDSVYPRALSGSEGFVGEFYDQREFIRGLVNSESFIFDNWKTILIEDKDLRFLTNLNPNLKKYIPENINVGEGENLKDLSNYVLKIKDLHSGRGVIVSPNSLEGIPSDAILQKKVFTNKYPVLTNYGNSGDALYDTGVHVSYTFDRSKDKLVNFDVAGLLTRFTLNKDGLVNMCRGGGMIPTFREC